VTAFYNEPDPYAAAWLRNLIAAGHVAPGVVDERKIQDIEAWELATYTQCHFFAGVGVWSHALRRAGWPDDRPVWTGSCPCQPFSAAGQQKGFDDERHLWPVWFRLIEQRRPAIVLGEQVASALQWVDLVSADMESAGYAFGASDLCAAGFGQPGVGGFHIRQRLYFVAMADTDDAGSQGRDGVPERAGECAAGPGGLDGGMADAMLAGRTERGTIAGHGSPAGRGAAGGVADTDGGHASTEGEQRGGQHGCEPQDRGPVRRGDSGARAQEPECGMADADSGERDGLAIVTGHERDRQDAGRTQECGEPQPCGDHFGMADADQQGSGGRGICGPDEGAGAGAGASQQRPAGLCQDRHADAPDDGRPVADWLFCRDGKWRPVEPGTFPLADAAPARVGRLRAYGNALDAETATQFCSAVKEITDAVRPLAEYDL
jgi:DNA (cytosine-5)-methyltransferase 1